MLLWLAYGAGRRAWQGSAGLLATQQVQVKPWQQTALTALAITLLNPHVYLDTVVLIGGVGTLQPQPAWFTAGACLASFMWFSSLTALAPKLKTVLSSPKRWRIFDALVALTLTGIALKLAVV
jgi:L-lysine exporter family protein LysE/ArgO